MNLKMYSFSECQRPGASQLPQLCESFASHSCGLQDLHQDTEREPCSASNPQLCLHLHMDKLLAYVFHISCLLNELLYS